MIHCWASLAWNLDIGSVYMVTFPSHFEHTEIYVWASQQRPWLNFWERDFLFKDFILFLERGREGEKEEEKHQCVVATWAPPTGDPACNPGMCSNWELNSRPFGLQSSAQSTEPHQPGLRKRSLNNQMAYPVSPQSKHAWQACHLPEQGHAQSWRPRVQVFAFVPKIPKVMQN